MGRDDWFRGPGWDPATQEEFEAKLARARSQRVQYLRIKGLELTTADDPRVWKSGRDLLRRVFVEHPDERMWIIQAHHDLGASFAREGRHEEAIEHFDASLRMQRARDAPSVDPGTRLTLAELIAEARWQDRYEEAAAMLGEFLESRSGGLLFPVERFRVLLTEARMAEDLGQQDVARRDAEWALDLLAHNESILPRHPGVGTIRKDEETVRELERIASL